MDNQDFVELFHGMLLPPELKLFSSLQLERAQRIISLLESENVDGLPFLMPGAYGKHKEGSPQDWTELSLIWTTNVSQIYIGIFDKTRNVQWQWNFRESRQGDELYSKPNDCHVGTENSFERLPPGLVQMIAKHWPRTGKKYELCMSHENVLSYQYERRTQEYVAYEKSGQPLSGCGKHLRALAREMLRKQQEELQRDIQRLS